MPPSAKFKLGTEIIGVVKTGKYRTLGEDPIPVAYLPQLPPRRTLVVRTSGDPVALLDPDRARNSCGGPP